MTIGDDDAIDNLILDNDDLIDLTETLRILGNPSVSTAYDDPELMALKINMTSPGRRTRMIRFVKRKVPRRRRVARAGAGAAKVRAEVEARASGGGRGSAIVSASASGPRPAHRTPTRPQVFARDAGAA